MALTISRLFGALARGVLGALAWPFTRFGAWVEARTGLLAGVRRIARHKAPRGSRWGYIWGSATLFALLLQVVTGITLALLYTPSTESAYQSLQHISAVGTFPRIVRGMHYFGASAMVVLMLIHLARVYLTAAYKFPRELNWLIGVGLLLFTLAMAFTGQLLRWDADAIWSAVVGAEQAARTPLIGTWFGRFILGGPTVNAESLSRYFAAHVFWLPALLLSGVGFHLYLVLRNGVSEPTKPGEKVDPTTYRQKYRALLRRDGVPFWPDAAWRDVVAGTLVVLGVVLLAFLLGPPPLGKPPDPTIIDVDPHPDWYFIWYFALLAVWRYRVGNVLMILVPLLIFGGLFLLPLVSNRGERSPWRRPWAPALVLTALAVMVTYTVIGYREPWLPRFSAPPLPASVVASSDPAVVRGAALWHQKGCEDCHRIAGYGGLRGPDLTDVGARLPATRLTWRIANGGYGMPPYGPSLSSREIEDLTRFLSTRLGRSSSAGGPR